MKNKNKNKKKREETEAEEQREMERDKDDRTPVLVKRKTEDEPRIEMKHLPEIIALKGDLNVEWYDVEVE